MSDTTILEHFMFYLLAGSEEPLHVLPVGKKQSACCWKCNGVLVDGAMLRLVTLSKAFIHLSMVHICFEASEPEPIYSMVDDYLLMHWLPVDVSMSTTENGSALMLPPTAAHRSDCTG
jgi:hypothetical protein